MAVIKTSNLELDFNKGIKTNVEIVDGKLQLEVIGTTVQLTDDNIVPKMSSDTTPAPYVASASSFSNSTYLPWKAFNMTNINQDDCWVSASGTTSGWIQIDLSEPESVILL